MSIHFWVLCPPGLTHSMIHLSITNSLIINLTFVGTIWDIEVALRDFKWQVTLNTLFKVNWKFSLRCHWASPNLSIKFWHALPGPCDHSKAISTRPLSQDMGQSQYNIRFLLFSRFILQIYLGCCQKNHHAMHAHMHSTIRFHANFLYK